MNLQQKNKVSTSPDGCFYTPYVKRNIYVNMFLTTVL